MSMNWRRPTQQLIRDGGNLVGQRNLFPIAAEDIANLPGPAESMDNPWLNHADYVSSYADFENGDMPQGWTLTNVGIGSGVAVLTGERNGALQLASGTSLNGYTLVANGSQTVLPWINVRNPYMQCRAVLTTNLGTAAVRHIGFGNDFTAVTPANFIGFRTLGGSANWFAVTRAAGVETTTDSGVAAAIGTWYLFIIQAWARGTKVSFEMWSDANPRKPLLGRVTHTANIPTVALAAGLRTMQPNPAEAATRDIAIDFADLVQLRQTPV